MTYLIIINIYLISQIFIIIFLYNLVVFLVKDIIILKYEGPKSSKSMFSSLPVVQKQKCCMMISLVIMNSTFVVQKALSPCFSRHLWSKSRSFPWWFVCIMESKFVCKCIFLLLSSKNYQCTIDGSLQYYSHDKNYAKASVCTWMAC